jgi:hypothetical protein
MAVCEICSLEWNSTVTTRAGDSTGNSAPLSPVQQVSMALHRMQGKVEISVSFQIIWGCPVYSNNKKMAFFNIL